MIETRTRPIRSIGPVLGFAVLTVGLALSCSPTTHQADGLELIIVAEGLSAPADFNEVRLEVYQQFDGGAFWIKEYFIPSQELEALPATFGITAGGNPNQQALIRVTAFQGTTPVVLREAQVQVPNDRVAELTLVLAKVCAGQVRTVGAEGGVQSLCPDGKSCQPDTGMCGSIRVDSKLPDYDAAAVAAARAQARVEGGGARDTGSTDVTVNGTGPLGSMDATLDGPDAPLAVTCPNSLHDCNGMCVDQQTDSGNCGGCGKPCLGGKTCQSGACACPAGTPTDCGGQCTNTRTDPHHCGTCAQDCLGATCSAGACVHEAGPGGCVPTTATENCTDGLDDDCNGIIDCAEAACQSAGYTCTSPPPAGWIGPALLWTGAFGASAPACPPSYQAALDAHMGPTGSPDTCTCSCVASGETCSATATFHVDQTCAAPPCATTTAASNGTCTPVPANNCGAGGSVVVGTGAAPTGGSCSPNVTRTPGPAPGWTTSARVCRWTGPMDTPGGCNMPSDQCLLGPPTGFAQTMCVFQSGTPACPAAYPNPTILYSSESDARGCGSCVCSATPTGGSCAGMISAYGSGTGPCTGTAVTYTLGSGCLSYFAPLNPNPAFVQGQYTLSPGACSITTQPQPTGGVVGTGPTTVCCK